MKPCSKIKQITQCSQKLRYCKYLEFVSELPDKKSKLICLNTIEFFLWGRKTCDSRIMAIHVLMQNRRI